METGELERRRRKEKLDERRKIEAVEEKEGGIVSH